ncbi:MULTISPECIES: homoserine dehydrogenase [Asticcacaulis]|uniref:amino acid kinase family protein n=1 Tax=Asticcacaulis TaxID=76890 RepID=UPI001AE5ED00|nr:MULTISPECIES: homoserine dehydrogenase [Asticcacaulis]MBP2160713.1 homoserine dehydrogenase [Asticcacaulis solisilvae]MDR6801758.1 homoserine dehydrogenase [Asticcacaulis sp. BE141]
MSILVVKFGGSVLVSESALQRAVSEIYRYVRDAHKVVAIVSAFKGETDQLLRLAGAYTQASTSSATPHLVATGEMRAATLFAMACERSGIVTQFRSAYEIGLIADGEHLNANPVSVNPEVLRSDLERVDLVVVPGYVAENAEGEPVLLGRGGSDLTAVYIAKALGVPVRLIKDVDAVYDADPATVGDSAKPYESLDWAEAIKIAFPVVQSKAMRYAADNGVTVQLAGLAKGYETTLGGQTAYRKTPGLKRKIRIAVMGAGGVGSKFLERCLEWGDLIEVDRILVRDAGKRRDHPLASKFTSDARSFARPDVDVFVDIGTGVSPSAELLEGFLKAGVSVTSANKQAVAAAGDKLRAAAKASGARLTYSASVGGGAPVIEALTRAVKAHRIKAFCGVLNGTSNFVIDQVESGKTFDAAMDEARRLGFAEPDSTADLDGTDVGAKLKLLREIAYPGETPKHIEVGQITEESLVIPEGKGLRYVARCFRTDEGLQASMKLEVLDADHYLVGARGEQNRAIIELDNGETWYVTGKGAGAWPTSEALLADVLQIAREHPLQA